MRWRLGLRWTLLGALLPLLALPWIGLRFVEHMAELTRDERLESQAAAARALAAALHERPELFGADAAVRPLPAGAQPLPVEEIATLRRDGRALEWAGLPSRPLVTQVTGAVPLDTLRVRIAAARPRDDAAHLVLLVEVDDERLVRPQPAGDGGADGSTAAAAASVPPTPPVGASAEPRADRPGPPMLPGDELIVEAGPSADALQRVPATPVEREGGWRAEVVLDARVRLLRVRVLDVDYLGSRQVDAEADSGLLAPAPLAAADDGQREQAIRAGMLRALDSVAGRVSVYDAAGVLRAQRGEVGGPIPEPDGWQGRLARALLAAAVRMQPEFVSSGPSAGGDPPLSPLARALGGSPAQQSQRLGMLGGMPSWLLTSTQPIWHRDRIVGALVLEENTAARLALGQSALERLTLWAALAVAATVLALLAMASITVARVVRLRDEADAAIDARGRVVGRLRPARLDDELGQLRNRHARVLERLREHQDYLAKLRARLVHELRTPIMVVRSSLENLAAETDPARREAFVARVQSGAARLERIVSSMGEASSLETLLAGSELERVDLAELLAGCVDGYRGAFAPRAFVLHRPDGPAPCPVVPEAIAQALDKLVSNAADFATPGSPIELALEPVAAGDAPRVATGGRWRPWRRSVRRPAGDPAGSGWRITVTNAGPDLPEAMADSLFDPMVSIRPDRASDRSHLGLGLYLVRLIAEFHGGRAFIGPVPGGVRAGFTVATPRHAPAAGDAPAPRPGRSSPA
jgi:signal transduction histidine kinase